MKLDIQNFSGPGKTDDCRMGKHFECSEMSDYIEDDFVGQSWHCCCECHGILNFECKTDNHEQCDGLFGGASNGDSFTDCECECHFDGTNPIVTYADDDEDFEEPEDPEE